MFIGGKVNQIKVKIAINVILIGVIIITSLIFEKNTQVMGNTEEKHPIYCVDTEEKVISLTFDINWAEKDNLPIILDIMDKYNVKGTFFIMGGWVEYSEDNVNKLKSIYERGHEIGNHSYKHPSFTNITESAMEDEIIKTDEIIEKYTGTKPTLFRFPSGDYNKLSVMKVKSLNHQAIQWDADSVDWKELGAEIEYNKVIQKVKNGSILLFHNNAKYTPQNLERIINTLKNQGYEFKTVGEMIYENNYYVDETGTQRKK